MARLRLLPCLQLCLAAFHLPGEVAGTHVVPVRSPATASAHHAPEHRLIRPPKGPRLRPTGVVPQGGGCLRVPAAWPSHQHGNKALVTGLILLGGISNG